MKKKIETKTAWAVINDHSGEIVCFERTRKDARGIKREIEEDFNGEVKLTIAKFDFAGFKR